MFFSDFVSVISGPLAPEVTVKYGAIAVIFFFSGMSLNFADMKKAVVQFKLHAFIQLFTFLFVPICVRLITFALRLFGINEWVLKGYVIHMCCNSFVQF